MTQALIELMVYLMVLCAIYAASGIIAALVTLIATKWANNDP